jgi:hypothetical protein
MYIIPIRVDDSGDSDISRNKDIMWPSDVISDNAGLELKRLTVVEQLVGRCSFPGRGASA